MKKFISRLFLTVLLLAVLCCTAAAVEQQEFVIADGVLTEYHGTGGAVVVPDGVREIGMAFMDNPKVTSVTIPGSVQKIGSSAFARCEKLSAVTLSEGLLTIEDFAFYQCPITRLYIPDSVAFIGSCAFVTTQLTEVRLPSTTQVWDDAFATSPWGKAHEERVLIERLPTVGNEAWVEFTSTEPTAPTTRNGDFTMRGSVVVGYQGAGGVVTIPEGASAIGARAFYYNTGITDVVFGDAVKLIGASAFEGCTALRRVSPLADDFYRVCRNAFMDCQNLTSFDRPYQTPVSQNSFLNTPFDRTGGQLLPTNLQLTRKRAYQNEFTDMNAKTWCYPYVVRAYEAGVLDCPTDKKLRADSALSAGEAVKTAALIHASVTGNLSKLESPAPGFKTYYDYVRRYFRYGTSELENANQPVSRNVFAGLMYDAIPRTGWPTASGQAEFPDLDQYDSSGSIISSVDHQYEINYFYKIGVCVPYGDGKFHPERNITRGEAFVMAARVIDPSLRAS